ncbi:hypothetical protein [Dyella choica]|uniref:Pertussis toxin subunit 1 n=1 Tax=Dyella choica TaxID=1927959 RepID=A0A3S0PKN4_9GAMM|nr:hypothetical protein [Dyella choica]RUL70549.1 hypothetical protein EKH80_20375 [Dyella choica]
MNKLKIIFLLLTLFYSIFANAEPPSTVYRADFRSPDTIFDKGFEPYGSNSDLADHQIGLSCGSGSYGALGTANSAYVSVSSTLEANEAFISRAYSSTSRAPRIDIWMYTIRATENFHDSYSTVTNALDSPNPSIAQRAQMAYFGARLAMQAEAEYVALGGIDRSLVREARRYSWNNITSRYEPTTDVRTNDRYVARDTRANANPLAPNLAFRDPTTNSLLRRITTIGHSIFGVCICMSKSSTQRYNQYYKGQSVDYNEYCDPTVHDERGIEAINLMLLN